MTRPLRPSTHFSWEEVTVRWPGGVKTPGRDLPRLTERAASALVRVCAVAEVIRADVGAPVHVTSGFRFDDPRQHGDGQALDIQVRGMSPLEIIGRIHRLHSAGRLPGLRQVIAESRGAGLTGPMDENSGRWVHVAILGIAGEDWSSDAPRRTARGTRRATRYPPGTEWTRPRGSRSRRPRARPGAGVPGSRRRGRKGGQKQVVSRALRSRRELPA